MYISLCQLNVAAISKTCKQGGIVVLGPDFVFTRVSFYDALGGIICLVGTSSYAKLQPKFVILQPISMGIW